MAKKLRIPVLVKLYDADLHEHVVGPLTVEIDEPRPELVDHPGAYISAIERAAAEFLKPDMQCNCDT